MSNAEADDRDKVPTSDIDIAQIRDALRGLRLGAVNILVQDGVIVQIDRTEKRRLVRRSKSTGA